MNLRKKIQILLVFLVGMPLLLLLYESYQAGRHTLMTQMKHEALQIARLETAEMDLTFGPPRIIAEGLARALEADPAITGDGIRELLRRTLQNSPEIYGVAVAFDPSATTLGRFAPYVYRRNGIETETDILYEYTGRDWYRIPVKNGRGKWIKPYFGEGGNALMITYAIPVRRGGGVVGVAAVDLDLVSLHKRLSFLKPGGDGTVYLVNPAGTIMAHPALKAMITQEGSRNLGELAALMKRRGLDTMNMIDPVSKRRSWVVEYPVDSLSAARGGGDWSLIVSWPLDKRMAPLNALGRHMLILYLFMGGAALWFLNRAFDDTITRPLHRLAEQARGYAQGDFRQTPEARNDSLELKEMKDALNSLGSVLEKNFSPAPSGKEDTQ
jgi:sigma-B regulation protein RsbU (phosphoserine phosphatase)